MKPVKLLALVMFGAVLLSSAVFADGEIDDSKCVADGGTCTTILQSSNINGYFDQGLCAGPNNRQCRVPDSGIRGCQSCLGALFWCFSSTTGYCAIDNCLPGFEFVTIDTSERCVGIIGDEGTGSVPSNPVGSATVTLRPSQPVANQNFAIDFTLSAPLQTGQNLVYTVTCSNGATPQGTIQCAGSSFCTTNNVIRVGAGTCTIFASAGGNQLSLNPSTFEVVASTQASTPNTNQCCVTKFGESYVYESDKLQSQCSGAYYQTNCNNIQNSECDKLCRLQGSSGRCELPSASANQLDSNVCGTGQLRCTCGTSSYNANNRYIVACSEACFTYSYSSSVYNPYFSNQQLSYIPIGQCTDNPQAIIFSATIGTQTGVTGGTLSRQPQILPGPSGASGRGSYQCEPNEYCVCTFIDVNSFTASPNRPSIPTLPGSIPAWPDPDDITATAPRATPNDHICDLPDSNATITASISSGSAGGNSGLSQTLRLIQAGDTVTITGSVAKLSATCKGYTYTCQQQQVVGCEINSDLGTVLSLGVSRDREYKDCPAALSEIVHEEGEGRSNNYRLLAAIGITAVTMGAAGPAAASALGSAGITTSSAAILTAGTFIDGLSCGTPNENAGTNLAIQANLFIQSSRRNGINTNTNQNTQTNEDTQTNPCLESCNEKFLIRQSFCDDNYESETDDCDERDADDSCYDTAEVRWNNCANNNDNEAKRCSDSCNPVTGGATTYPTFSVTGMATINPQAGSLITGRALAAIPACPTQAELDGCFRVCGRTYESRAAAAPTCERGGRVKDYKETPYACAQGSCGGFAGKRVDIIVKDPAGATVITDTTTTDANGDFSYTFNAPAADGQFTAVVSVPKG